MSSGKILFYNFEVEKKNFPAFSLKIRKQSRKKSEAKNKKTSIFSESLTIVFNYFGTRT